MIKLLYRLTLIGTDSRWIVAATTAMIAATVAATDALIGCSSDGRNHRQLEYEPFLGL